jgi:3-hydroxybutyryl-CoA dehydrogenase
MDEKNVAIIGSGRMGIGIATALLLANRGLGITMVDLKQRPQGQENESLDNARNEIESNLKLLKELGELGAPPQELLESLSLSKSLEKAVKDTAIIFEALPERPELKQDLILCVEPMIQETAIIASATSTIGLETFWEVSSRPEMIITAHWLNPAFIIPLVEVSTGVKTGDGVAEKAKKFLLEMGKIPVVIKQGPGFIVPRIQTAAMNEAVRIVEEGIASPEDVDTAIKAGFGFRLAVLGLIEFIDLGGLDILYYASKFLSEKLGQPQYQAPKSVVEKMEKGEIGPRAGKGYFDYSSVDIDAMFGKRYRGFVELLKLVRSSDALDFKGGIRD